MPRLAVAVTPRAARERIGPFADGVLRVRVTRPPADGDANRAVLRAVAAALDLAIRDVRLVSGERGRRKLLEISGLSEGELRGRLERFGR